MIAESPDTWLSFLLQRNIFLGEIDISNSLRCVESFLTTHFPCRDSNIVLILLVLKKMEKQD